MFSSMSEPSHFTVMAEPLRPHLCMHATHSHYCFDARMLLKVIFGILIVVP